jgi:adenylate cyclase
MLRKRKFNFKEWGIIIFAWIAITNTYSWYVLANFKMFFQFSDTAYIMESSILTRYFFSGYQYLEASLFGLIFGTLFAFVNHITENLRILKNSFGKVILFRSILYTVSLAIAVGLIFGIFLQIGLFTKEFQDVDMMEILDFEASLAIAFFFISTIVLINFIIQVSRKFGPGNLIKMLIGKYAKPREEQRIFMFLDLNDSTTIAERLGHLKYSSLLQDCFHDLTHVVLKYEANIYQYVGDEVVLSWRISKGLDESNCIKTFFSFDEFLKSRKLYYEEKYGNLPEFKAGLDMGTVTVTEIGDIKREIAYHGDVLNTASRIQHLCREKEQKMMISEKLANHLQFSNQFTKNLIGKINLKGKKSVTKLYGISYNQ